LIVMSANVTYEKKPKGYTKQPRAKRGDVSTTRSPDSVRMGYDITTWRGNGKRRAGGFETGPESSMMNDSQRLRFINLVREGMRNMAQVRTLAQQLRVNVVGINGGKLSSTTAIKEWDDAVGKFWKEYTESVDYIDGKGLNELLKLILTELSIGGGDFVLMFDDGCLESRANRGHGCGKVRPFESDNIGDMEPAEFQKRFPGYSQKQGLIYNANGRMVGVIVSPKKRGLTVFAKTDCFALTRDPDTPWWMSFWYFGKRNWRLIQERGISPQVVAIALLIDLFEIQSSETQTAKVAAQTLGQIIDKMGNPPEEDDDDPIEDEIKKECAGPHGEEGGADNLEAGSETAPALAQGFEFDDERFSEATSGGHVFKMLPETELKLLETKRPNPNVQSFIDWLQRNAGAVHGLTSIYSTLKAEASYTAFRGEQSMAMPSFEEAQKELERGALSWIAIKAIQWAFDIGKIKITPPDGWRTSLAFQWPKMREVNEKDAQQAVSLKFQNKVISYMELLGADWEKKLDQIALEVKKCVELGIIHPSQLTGNGMFTGTPENGNPENEDGK